MHFLSALALSLIWSINDMILSPFQKEKFRSISTIYYLNELALACQLFPSKSAGFPAFIVNNGEKQYNKSNKLLYRKGALGLRVTGIVAEYNPFHNGHLYHLELGRTLTDADYTVAIMSGNFVQRGEPCLLYTSPSLPLFWRRPGRANGW